MKNAKLVAVCDVKKDKAEAIAEKFSVRAFKGIIEIMTTEECGSSSNGKQLPC